MIHTRMAAEKALSRHTGIDASRFDVVGDPIITGVWAARDDRGYQYLIHASEEIEEVEFKEWPPHATI